MKHNFSEIEIVCESPPERIEGTVDFFVMNESIMTVDYLLTDSILSIVQARWATGKEIEPAEYRKFNLHQRVWDEIEFQAEQEGA